MTNLGSNCSVIMRIAIFAWLSFLTEAFKCGKLHHPKYFTASKHVSATRSWGLRRALPSLSATVLSEEGVEVGPVINQQKRSKVQSYVDSMGGRRALQRILIANNGMAATKAILSIRQWAYKTFGELV